MKTLIFWILKLLELLAVVFVPYFVGSLFFHLMEDPRHWITDWGVGFGLLFLGGGVFCAVFVFVSEILPDLYNGIVKTNKEWASKIYDRTRRNK